MLKTKYALSALGLLVAMTMATDALAQGVFSVSSSIVPRARANGHTELAGGVTLARAASPTGDAGGTVTIDYGVAITNRFDNVKRTHPDRVKGTHPRVNGL